RAERPHRIVLAHEVPGSDGGINTTHHGSDDAADGILGIEATPMTILPAVGAKRRISSSENSALIFWRSFRARRCFQDVVSFELGRHFCCDGCYWSAERHGTVRDCRMRTASGCRTGESRTPRELLDCEDVPLQGGVRLPAGRVAELVCAVDRPVARIVSVGLRCYDAGWADSATGSNAPAPPPASPGRGDGTGGPSMWS